MLALSDAGALSWNSPEVSNRSSSELPKHSQAAINVSSWHAPSSNSAPADNDWHSENSGGTDKQSAKEPANLTQVSPAVMGSPCAGENLPKRVFPTCSTPSNKSWMDRAKPIHSSATTGFINNRLYTRNNRLYTRLTPGVARQQLIAQKGYADSDLPGEEALRQRLNRLGYYPKKVKKSLPKKR
jgi:hypothetical protein